MRTRLTAITTLAGLAVGVAVAPAAGPAFAEPRDSTPTFEPVTTGRDDVVPVTSPPSVPDRADEADDDAPTGRDDVGAPIEPKLRFDPVEEARSSTTMEVLPGIAPDLKPLAPCGFVPHNLDPQGPMVLADMTGDGSANDRLSIRQVGSGSSLEYRLHLELDDGTRSEAHIGAFEGYLPTISDRIQLWQESTIHHPAPAADEAVVTFGEVGTTRYWRVFGTDERGCIAGYTNEIGSPATVVFRHDDTFRAGWSCNSLAQIKVEDATNNGDGTWDLRKFALRRTGATTVESAWLYGAYNVPTSAVGVYGAGC